MFSKHRCVNTTFGVLVVFEINAVKEGTKGQMLLCHTANRILICSDNAQTSCTVTNKRHSTGPEKTSDRSVGLDTETKV